MPTQEERQEKPKAKATDKPGVKPPKNGKPKHHPGKVSGKYASVAAGGNRERAAKVGRRSMPTTVPTPAEIESKTTALTGPAAAAFGQIVSGLSDHLGSPEAARLWLVTPSGQFETTPLDAIAAGEAEAVLAFLESRWGPGPAYA